MACGCNSTQSTGTYNGYAGSPSCPLPVRTSTAPTVPQIVEFLPRVIPKSSGGILLRNGDEMNVLDSPVNGAVMFDAETGKAYVGDWEVTQIPDNYACTATTTYGYPVYGVRPECGSSTEFPARDLGILRPTRSSTGVIWAHQRSCGGISGPAQEITPVEITPDPWPNPIPNGLVNLSYVPTEANECGSVQARWYANPGQIFVPNGNNLLFDFPNRELTVADDADFRIMVSTKYDANNFLGKTITNASFQAYIDTRIGLVLEDDGYAPSYLNPRQALVTQGITNEIYPYIYGPYDLSAYPGYNANSKEVQLFIRTSALTASAGGQVYTFSIIINGVLKYTSYCGPDPYGVHASAEIHVPIPANKQLMIEVEKLIVLAGSSGPPSLGFIEVSLEAFK